MEFANYFQEIIKKLSTFQKNLNYKKFWRINSSGIFLHAESRNFEVYFLTFVCNGVILFYAHCEEIMKFDAILRSYNIVGFHITQFELRLQFKLV